MSFVTLLPMSSFARPLAGLAFIVLSVGVLSVGACSKDSEDGTPSAAAAAVAKSDAPGDAGGQGARPAGGGPGGGGPGGRNASIVLAATDVKTVERGTIEAGIQVSGDLKPIEEAAVRARLEGDLVGVYVREGDRVRQGQLLARFEDSEQESDRVSALAEREAVQSDVETAKWNADQSAELFKAGAIAERDNRAAQQTYAAARARLAAAEARVRATTSLVSDTRALSPTTGIVAQRLVENGEHVARGAHMFTVVRADVLELAAAVPARQANEVRVGQRAHFAAGGQQLDGRVARVSPTIDPTNRSITVFVRVPNAAGELKGNAFATGRIVSRAVDGAIVIPAMAIRQAQGNEKSFVYRLGAGDALERAPVSVGIVDETLAVAEILEGLAPGDRIIVGNVGTLGAGMKVTIAGGGEGPQGGNAGAGNRRPPGP